MKIKLVKELKPYSVSELNNIFEEEDYFEDIIKSLSIMNILRQINKESSDFELEDLIDVENLTDINEIDGNMYVFRFVGIIYINEICLVSYPKYISNITQDKKNNFEIIKLIISVIRKYNSKSQRINFGKEEINNFNLLATGLEIIEDYFESGLYRNDKEIIDNNTDGEILWDKTINETSIILVDNFPFYFDTYHRNQIDNNSDFFTILHSAIINDINIKLKEIFELIGFESIYLDAEDLDFNNREYILYKINQEYSQQFITSKQKKLLLMKKYINNEEGSNVAEKISFVGTNHFNLIWEDVCSVVNNNSNKKSLKELGLKFKNGGDSMNLSDVISRPKWTPNSKNITHTAQSTLIPDIITIKDGNLFIFDAKYYKMTLDDKGVRNHPGISDVTKQYLYELSYKAFAEENGLNIVKNAFLLPSEYDEEVNLGTVDLDIFSLLTETTFNEIEVILVSANNYYREYLLK
ncbi:LlaJI family restriction endonuclease [Macrococcus capreoli]|uniref:LlaJI family restriction endonuclease n=1 Tax=Macrococcus capreoli TaxID=2982690 RepID=UPI0021D57D3E|nr:LlaJI family restriction endonuclease [Macrococcus sp. TMW 2.2395]MCU7558188.1 LlaJI family restriction endonuclease [Macrococcus sp. TMW 2.2395]